MTDIHPIRSVISISFIGSDFIFFVILIALLSIILFLIFIQLKKKNTNRLTPIRIQKTPNIQEVYLKKLNQLKKIWKAKHSKEICTELTKLLKDFVHEQKNINLQTKTTEESQNVIESQQVQDILTHLDSIKFSHIIDDYLSEIEKAFAAIKNYINT